jgi:hypothetical protein
MALVPGGDRSPDMRVSDADRNKVVDLLRRHCADGRLTVVEFEDRAEQALGARTVGDLDAVMRDLPAMAPPYSPPRPERRPAPRRSRVDPGFRAHRNVYLVIHAFLVFIWLVTDPGGYFWPMWPAAGWGIALALHWAGTGGRGLPPADGA